jgi:hypothetical protein
MMKIRCVHLSLLALPSILAAVVLLGCPQSEPPATETAPDETTEPAVNASAPCAPGSKCLTVDSNGAPNAEGTSTAQCTGTFPDYVVEKSLFPADYDGPWFQLSQDFPATEPAGGDAPWLAIDFENGQEGADAYLYALRDYSYEGMIEADFIPQDNDKRAWYHIPMMNFGSGRRELVHGVTKERTLKGPELGIKPGVSVSNYAIGFYNDFGGYVTGQVWADGNDPDLSASRFDEGTMVFKILFSAATPDDFQDPANYILEGAPEWQIATGNGQLTTVRLMQMDVAARDDRAQPSGWVYGTFAFDRDAEDENPWLRMRPVGLMWGNDPGYTPTDQQNGVPLEESVVSDEIPAYAAGHLGWAGRVNGPVDNPISACMSCHQTAQYPVDAQLAPFSSGCKTDAQKLYWFRNVPAGEPFGAVDTATCLPEQVDPLPVALDTSLQMQVAVQSVLQYKDVNSCQAAEAGFAAGLAAAVEERTGSPHRTTDAPRVSRGGEGE